MNFIDVVISTEKDHYSRKLEFTYMSQCLLRDDPIIWLCTILLIVSLHNKLFEHSLSLTELTMLHRANGPGNLFVHNMFTIALEYSPVACP
jgi:hypothetical protein